MHTVSQQAFLLQRALGFLFFYLAPAIRLSNVCIFAGMKNTLKILVDWLQSSYFMSLCILSIIGA